MTTTARFHGPQGGVKSGRAGEKGRGRNKGTMAAYRQIQRGNAEARDALTKVGRRRIDRCPDKCGHVNPAYCYTSENETAAVLADPQLMDDLLQTKDPAAIKLLTEIFADQTIQEAGEAAIEATKPRRRRRNITRQHKAHTTE
jgi:hypothetical protein